MGLMQNFSNLGGQNRHVRVLNWGFRKGELSCTPREGIIIFIPKEDKRRDLIKNWRPMSLLNVVYKIGSAVTANRIKTMLPELINEDQTGFKSGKYVGDNLRLIYDIIIIMYIYHALINVLSAHMIHINLNMIFYTHVKHSPTKTIYIKYYLKNNTLCK